MKFARSPKLVGAFGATPARSPSARYGGIGRVASIGALSFGIGREPYGSARSPLARYGGIVAALLLASVASGCFLDEIDKSVNAGKVKAEAVAPGGAKPGDGAAPKQVASANGAKSAAAPAGPSWWQTATTLGSEESSVDAVACKLGAKLEFMTRDDCLSRGGSP